MATRHAVHLDVADVVVILLMATRNPAVAPVEVGSFSHDLQGFRTIPGGFSPDF